MPFECHTSNISLPQPSCISQDFTDKKSFHSNQWNTLKTDIESKGCCHKLFSYESTSFPVFCTKYQTTVDSFQIYQLGSTSCQLHDTIVNSCSIDYILDFATPTTAMSAICWYNTSNSQIRAPLTKVYTSPIFCKKYQAIVNFFAGTSWVSGLLNYIN